MQWIFRIRVCVIICLAVILITAAVIFSVLRAVLPYATGYKNEIQQEISQQIGLPVEINSIDAAINWFSPRLKLIGVSVFDEKNRIPLFNFREAFVELDVIASILRLEIIVDDIGLVGTDLSIEKLSEEEWLLQGITFTSEGSSELPDQFIYMLKNADYLLHDSNIYYKDHTGEKLTLNLLDVNVDVKNNFNNHDIKFSMNLLEPYGKDLAVVANLSGDIDSLKGDIYIEANKLNVRELNKKFTLTEGYRFDGILDVNLWVTLEASKIQSLFSQLSVQNVLLKNKATEKSWKSDYLSANFRYLNDDGHFNFAVSDFYFGEKLQPSWERKAALIVSNDDENYYLSADFLRVQDLPAIVEVFLSDRHLTDLEKVKSYQLKADVYNLDLQLPREMSMQKLLDSLIVEASLMDFSMSDAKNNISLSGFDGLIQYADKRASIDVSASDTKVEFKNLFRKPLFAELIQGQLSLAYTEDSWHLTSDRLQLKNKHINTFSNMDVQINSAEDIFINAQTDFYDAYTEHVNQYLPVGIMKPGLINWLDMAITDGFVPSGSFVLHGKLSDFPYTSNNGVFQVLFFAQDVNLKFLGDWPLLNDTSATVKFANQSLFVTNVSAKTQNVSLFNGSVDILNLANAHLKVTANAHGNNDDIQSYIWNSALDNVLGDAMRLFQLQGTSNLKLKIDTPLRKEDIDVAVDGHLELNNTKIYFPAMGYEITGINGTLDFTQDSVFAESMDALVQGEAVKINAFTHDGESGREAVFHLQGKMGVDYLLQHYDWIPHDWASGKSIWAIDIELPYKPVDYLVHVRANSSLQNTAFNVSDKVNKPAASKIGFSADINVLANRGLHIESKAKYVDAEEINESSIFDLYAARDENYVWNFDIDSEYITGQGAFTQGLDKNTQIKLDLANIDLQALFFTKNKKGANALKPSDFPPLNWDAAKVLWNDLVFTDVRIETDWHEYGMLINTFSMKGPEMSIDAHGTWLTSWRDAHRTVLEGAISSNNLGQTLTGLGFQRSIDRSDFKAKFDAKWSAEPYDLSWAKVNGKASFEMNDGEILEADPGAGGRLLGLLNIFKLTNRLAFDFDDVTREGFSFDYIKGEFEFVNGDGSLKNFDVSAPAADINMFGSINLIKQDYGLLMRVKPHTDSLTFAGGALLGGVVVGAGLALIQKVFDLGVIGHNVYSITGSWDDPVIEKIVERNVDKTDDDDF